MPTSGTVSTTVFKTRKVVEEAYRRCRIRPQALGPERVQTALDILFLRLSAMANNGIALWAVQKEILPLYAGTFSVPLPLGSVDLLNVNLRQLQRFSGTASASEGDAENAFDNDLQTACIQTLPDGNIDLELESATQATNFGLMPNATGTWSFEVQGSDDGATWETFYTAEELAVVDGEWQWWDIEGMQAWEFFRLQATDGTILNVTEFVIANMPSEIPCAALNRDQYSDLPNKSFLGRPVQYWYDKQIPQPYMRLWPAPGEAYTFWQLVCYVHRYVQDVGSLSQELEIPQSWYMAMVARLAGDLAITDEDVDPTLAATLDGVGEREWLKAWDGQSDGSRTTLMPRIGMYTR
jgi:hypothetical protein